MLVPVYGQPQNLNLADNLTAKFTALNLAAAEFEPIFKNMEALFNAQSDIIKIMENDQVYHRVVKATDDYSMLKTINENVLLDAYFPAIINDNVSPFTNFTTEHRDAYVRLRFRAENRLR